MQDPFVLVLYYSVHGATKKMADLIAEGVESIPGMSYRLRTVPSLNTPENDQETSFVTKQELRECAGIILGSPTRFGNMAAPLKHFIDSTSDVWLSGGLINKPAGVFTSSSSMHGGQETTLFSMLLPLMHHGAILVGLPYSIGAVSTTNSGGTPYGASHVAGTQSNKPLTKEEETLCFELGARVAKIAAALSLAI